jgi:hypothetical protein
MQIAQIAAIIGARRTVEDMQVVLGEQVAAQSYLYASCTRLDHAPRSYIDLPVLADRRESGSGYNRSNSVGLSRIAPNYLIRKRFWVGLRPPRQPPLYKSTAYASSVGRW